MPHAARPQVMAAVEAGLESAIRRLEGFLAIPAISCDPAHDADVRRLAEHVRADLERVGFARARVLDLPEDRQPVGARRAHPCVAAEWLGAGAGKPTVLVYGHLDLQPVKGEPWDTPPHEPVRKQTPTGERLYARGAADDMAGWVSWLVATEAWFATAGALPCNVKLILEGEEEIGSPNLERFMDAFPDAFAADVMVLTDTENPSIDIPGLTVSLRGLLEVEVICASSTSDVHSGLYGNLVPDPAIALCMLVARLVDEDGRLKILPNPVDADWLAKSKDVPLRDDVLVGAAHLREGVKPLPERHLTRAAWAWRQPSVTILSTSLPQPGAEKNAIRKQASAVLSLRVAPGQTREALFAALESAAKANPPMGVDVRVTERSGGSMSWDYQAKGPAFEAADRAYREAWGREPLRIGIGGSIPFVALFGRRFGDLPLVLNGVMDPQTTAHGPNESLHLGVFHKAIKANVALLDELGEALTAR